MRLSILSIRAVACIALLCALPAAAESDVKARERRMREIEKIIEYAPREAVEQHSRLAQAARAKQDKAAELDALLVVSMSRATVGETDVNHEDEVRGEALARELDDFHTLSWFLEGKAWGLWWAGKHDEANRLMEQVIAEVKAKGYESRLAWLYTNSAQLLRRDGRQSDSMDLLTQAYAIFERDKQPLGMATALRHIGLLFGGALSPPEDQSRAAEYFRRAAALLDKRVHRVSSATMEGSLGLTLMRMGDLKTARRHLETAVEGLRAAGFVFLAAATEYQLANLHQKEGQPAKALAYLDRALQGNIVAWDKHLTVGSYVLRAELLAEIKRNREAREALVAVDKLMKELDQPMSAVEHYERMAAVYAKLGEYDEAYRQMQAMRAADLRLEEMQKSKLSDELRVRFDVQLKETENARLRAEKSEADTQRLVVALALALSLVVFASVAYFLRRRAVAARTEAQHHKALAEAEASANQAKSTFLANMSHELRSPLNAVLGFNRLLGRDARLPQDARDDLGIAVRSGEHLYALINQVLDLSKIESGRAVRTDSDFSLASLLEEMSDMFGLVAAEKQLQLVTDVTDGVPAHVRTDAVKLRQVLINLLGNALKFTARGSVTLRVAAEGEGEQCVLRFAVEDTGPGIDAAELDKLGNAFVQAQAGRQAKEGTGLGLAISRGFVELLGGRMMMESTPGQGTTIRFDVPVQVVHESEQPVPAETRRRRLASGQPAWRILVVDDRAESRALMRRLLEPVGFEVREAADGEQAVAEWKAWRPQLVWMDMRMPVMDGREATRRIRAAENDGKTVIVALTASSFEDEREQILANGCDDFLRKPFREEVLFDMMVRHLGVQFVFEEEAKGVETDGMRHALPEEVRAQLETAIASLDVDAIEKAVAAVAGYDALLAGELSALADTFDYGRMREMLAMRA